MSKERNHMDSKYSAINKIIDPSLVKEVSPNLHIIKSSSAQNLINEYKSPIFNRQTSLINNYVYQSNPKSIIFGNKKVNVTFGSPNTAIHKILESRPSLPNLHTPYLTATNT